MNSVASYLSHMKSPAKECFLAVWESVQKCAPRAEVGLRYGVPALSHKGKALIAVAAFKEHVGVYPFSPAVIRACADELAHFDTTKGGFKIAFDAHISAHLLKRIVTLRMREIESGAGGVAQVATKKKHERSVRRVCSLDPLQRGYTYICTEPVGRNFARGFTPDLTPKEMLALGVFDGWYFEGANGEFPASWFARVRLADSKPDPSLNYFGVHASQTREEWQNKGWMHPDDPRGWFQWYCRYYLGRRHEDDERQMKRWKAVRRHIAQLVKHCRGGDVSCRRVQRQALLHWAYDSRQY